MPTPDKIDALRLNGEVVSLADVLKELTIADDNQYRSVVASRLIVRREAALRDLSVSDSELQQAADAFRLQRGLSTAAATKAWLADRLWSVDDFEQHLEFPLLSSKLESVVGSPDAIERHFANNGRTYDRAEISHVVVADQKIADELLAQLNDDDADFGDLARLHSIDPLTARLGGRIGVTDRASLSTAIETAVFAALDGDVVGPLQTAMGWHLILVDRVIPGRLDDEISDLIRTELFQRWLDAQLERVEFPPIRI
mgnify:CR=1 FL=1